MSETGPRISVVVPTFHRPTLLMRCLTALVRQRFDPAAFEILVVDDGCSRATQTAVEVLASCCDRQPSIRYMRNEPTHGPAAARNRGWRHAAADIIAFTDDDTIPDPDWLAEGRAERIPSACHTDRTARVQTVDARSNPRFHALLRAFERRTGVPVLINTSFNVRGEPIVCTPKDAVDAFYSTPLDALVIGSFVLEKNT